MANPLTVPITPIDTWVKVATAVMYGIVRVTKNIKGVYRTTYRQTGDAAPVGIDAGVGLTGPKARISHDSLVDVYVFATVEVGEVEVWL